jgi:hypothetical protein
MLRRKRRSCSDLAQEGGGGVKIESNGTNATGDRPDGPIFQRFQPEMTLRRWRLERLESVPRSDEWRRKSVCRTRGSLVHQPAVRWLHESVRGDYNRGIFSLCTVFNTSSFAVPSDSTMSEDAGIEPRTVATSALAVRRTGNNRLAKIGIEFCQ